MKKIMIRVLFEDETGKRQIKDIYADTINDLVFEQRAIVGVGGKIIGIDNPVEIETDSE